MGIRRPLYMLSGSSFEHQHRCPHRCHATLVIYGFVIATYLFLPNSELSRLQIDKSEIAPSLPKRHNARARAYAARPYEFHLSKI